MSENAENFYGQAPTEDPREVIAGVGKGGGVALEETLPSIVKVPAQLAQDQGRHLALTQHQ